MSGIAIDAECPRIYEELKLGKKHRFIIFRMDSAYRKVVVETVGDRDANYNDFVSKMPENDSRYAVFDFEFRSADGLRNKLLFVMWAPETSPVRSKMLYASTKDSIKRSLQGVAHEIQATDLAEIVWPFCILTLGLRHRFEQIFVSASVFECLYKRVVFSS
ncbi:hypothetical protein RCL1_006405 [Eukaryota sp. TZLM3-RCL]